MSFNSSHIWWFSFLLSLSQYAPNPTTAVDIDRLKSVSFSGHRMLRSAAQGSLFSEGYGSQAGEIEQSLRSTLRATIQRLYDEGYTTFLCGMAEGFDLLAGDVVCDMKQNKYPDMELIAVIPHPAQAKYYDSQTLEIYHQLLSIAQRTVTLSQYYTPDCFHVRNDFLVDNSSVLLCFFNGSKGGTAYTVKQAVRKGLKIINTH